MESSLESAGGYTNLVCKIKNCPLLVAWAMYHQIAVRLRMKYARTNANEDFLYKKALYKSYKV